MSRMHKPAHPGEVLREYLPGSVSVTTAAEKLGVSRQAFSNLLNGKAGVSAEMAYRLSAALGTTPEFWLNLQISHDLWAVKQAGIPAVEKLAA
jgi:antitoxin HigA-1